MSSTNKTSTVDIDVMVVWFFVIFQTSDAQYLRTAMIMVFVMRKHENVIVMIAGIVWKIVQVNYFLSF